jgi:DnaJ-class molecular chaperone
VVEVEVIPSLQERVAAWGDQAAKRIAGGLSKLYRRTARAHFEAGRDKSLKLNIDLDTLFFGRQQRIRVKRLIACPSCQVGEALSDKKSASEHALGCERCLGEARVSSAEELSVMIPPGADDGHKLRVAGKGREGLKGQASGDLYLELIPPDLPKGFKRRGAQLLLELGVPAATLRRGGLVQAQTPRGTLSIPIPPESHSGKQLKISQQGLNIWGKSAQGSKLGDLIVTLRAR